MSDESSSRPIADRPTGRPTGRPTVAGRTLRAFVLLSLLWGLAFTALPVAPAAAAAPTPITTGVPRYEAGPCLYEFGQGQTEGQTVVCGTVVVAAKHDNPGGATIRLPVAVFKSLNPTPAAEATILLTGGPGQSGQVFAGLMTTQQPLAAFYRGVAANNDVIVFDQRGTGKSQPSLQCPETSGVTEQGLYLRAFADSPLVSAMNKCRDRLVAEGIDLSAYTTTENAADVNDIRLALGYPALNIIGGSYGSELGLAVARDFGQFVRTNNLVSIVPIQQAWYFEPPQSFDRALKELFRDCAANATCDAANPGLQAAFQKTVATLIDNPYPLKLEDPSSGQVIEVPLDGLTYTALLFQFFYDSSIMQFMPDIITRSSKGDFVWLENLLPAFLGSTTSDPLALGMHFSIVCSKGATQEQLNAALEADKSILPEARFALQPQSIDYFNVCQGWPSRGADPKGASPATSDRPTVLISGQFDPITPPRYADIAKETLPNATSVTLTGGGHSDIIPFVPSGICGFTVTISNIANPGKPDTACVGALRNIYRPLPASIAGPGASPSPAPSASPTPAPSASPTPAPSASPSPAPSASPLPSPPPTGNGGFLPGLPNTGDGGMGGGTSPWLLLVPFLALAVGLLPVARRRRGGDSQ